MREKLIELLIAAQDLITLSRKADFLIANGVTISVRCKDCRLWIRNGGFTKGPTGHCFCHDIVTTAHDFCSCGERITK